MELGSTLTPPQSNIESYTLKDAPHGPRLYTYPPRPNPTVSHTH